MTQMTEHELIEKILDEASRFDNCFIPFEELSKRIKEYLKQAGYVQLDENQELPENPFHENDESYSHRVYAGGQHSMLNSGFRRIRRG